MIAKRTVEIVEKDTDLNVKHKKTFWVYDITDMAQRTKSYSEEEKWVAEINKEMSR